MTTADVVPSPQDAPKPSWCWPEWRREKGYRLLARYVSPRSLVGLGLREDVADLRNGGSAARDVDRVVAERLYNNLKAKEIAYAIQPWVPGGVAQQIRHPWWLMRDKWGTCLDFATTYAAMCLEARVAPLLAVSSLGGDGHAFVVISSGRLSNARKLQPFALDGTDEDENGVLVVHDRGPLLEALAAGNLTVIDCVAATNGASFEEAVDSGGTHLRTSRWTLRLVDVPWLHELEETTPLDPPTARPAIRPYVPGVSAELVDFGKHSKLLADLRGEAGTVVLLGPSGQGKSTIARRLASDVPFGCGWFLNASEPQALINSLAEAELAERNQTGAGIAKADREGFAFSALGRLRDTEERWVVVLDNADGEPERLLPNLPRPNDRQLVVITTTNPDWRQLPGFVVWDVPPVDDEEVADVLGGSELLTLVAGRPLLLRAFRRLGSELRWSGVQIAKHAPTDPMDEEARGPATYWAALRQAPEFGDEEVKTSAYSSYLPPDYQPVALLADLVPPANDVVVRLAALGLVSYETGTESVRLHRLFGAAIRANLEETQPALCEEVVVRVARSDAALNVLDGYGDFQTISRLDERLGAMDARSGVDLALGLALYGVAGLLELHGHTRRSGGTYENAQRHFNPETEPQHVAGCLHGRARPVNQHYANDEGRLRTALEWAERAQALLETVNNGIDGDRCYAMQGLLKQKLAKFPEPGESVVALTREALAMLEDAHDRRSKRLGSDDPELARSLFNLAGVRIDLAKIESDNAAALLDAAEAVYEEVAKKRHRIYGRDVHPHIAACLIGFGYVNYFRALLISTAKREDQARWLRAATESTIAAIRQREAQEGALDLDETVKCAKFLAKVALARHGSPVAPVKTVASVADEAVRELTSARRLLAPMPLLPADGAGLDAAIDKWVRSPALLELVEEFGGELPERDVAGRLAWLEEFSVLWDFRAGKERNFAAIPQFLPATEKVILAVADALGMVGTTGPRNSHYEHVLILGGLVRGCLARPLHAAKLLRDGTITTDSVTALSAYRPLAGDELGLAERAGESHLIDEFGAMDAGVQRAFGVGEPVSDRGEESPVVGASWRVREYRTGADLAVRVVAAPSTEPGTRRSNTSDTYAWFATELAKLMPSERVLLVTSDIYRPFQHAEALRMLTLPYQVEIDAVGMRAGALDRRLTHEFRPHNYLQEVRSTIRAIQMLHSALLERARRLEMS